MKTSTSGTKTSLLERAPLPSPMEKLALTIQEAAQLSSLGQTSIYKAIREGQLNKPEVRHADRHHAGRSDIVSDQPACRNEKGPRAVNPRALLELTDLMRAS
jgi:hypothetical protein